MNSDILARLAGSLADRSEVRGELGAGGMATVYRALDRRRAIGVASGRFMHHVRLNSDVALDESALEALLAAAYREAGVGLIIVE
jgi:hypothetical protein